VAAWLPEVEVAMCVYCKAASTVLDLLWEAPLARNHFARLGADLAELGTLVHEVFAPTYKAFKARQDVSTLARLDEEVRNELLSPYSQKPNFQEAWSNWGDETKNTFLREQFEAKVAALLMRHYADDLFQAYKTAYDGYLTWKGSQPEQNSV
jgi:hypothetical protein